MILVSARENRVNCVGGGGAPIALGLHRPDYRSAAELRSELQWMGMLAAAGVQVPAPIAALDGSYLPQHGGTVVDVLTWLDGAPLSAGAVTPEFHADLVPDYVLLHNGHLYPIDFDDSGFGHRLFDLATITFRSRWTDPTGALAEAAIAGCRMNHQLDFAALPLFEAMRACTYLGWNMMRLQEDGAQVRNTRFIAEAVQSVQSYLEHYPT